MNKTPHVVHVAAWWPNRPEPLTGVFIAEHVRSVQYFTQSTVVHLRLLKEPSYGLWKIKVSKDDWNGIPFWRVDVSTRIRKWGIWQWLVRKAYKRVIGEISAHSPISLIHIHVADRFTRLLECPYPMVQSEHSSYFRSTQEPAEMQAVGKWFSNPNLKVVMPVSADLADSLHRHFGCPPTKMMVVPNVAPPYFKPASKAPIPWSIALVARWTEPKNPQVFVDAIDYLTPEQRAQLSIEWVGDGPQLAACQEQLKVKYPQIKVRYHGALTKHKVAEVMAAAAILVHPTDAENLPTVIAEALCCGTPVVSMHINGIPEMVNDTNGILVAPRDAKAMATAMVTLLSTELPRAQIANAAKAKFSPEAVGSKISAVYQQALYG